MRTPLSASPLRVTVTSSGSVGKSDIEAVEKKLTAKISDVEAKGTPNLDAICYLMDFYCGHAPYLVEVTEPTHLKALAALNTTRRRSLYTKLSKTQAWQDNKNLQLTQDEFMKLCEMAKVIDSK